MAGEAERINLESAHLRRSDLDDGDIGFAFDEFGINSKGDPLMRVGDNMITNMKTGEVHFVDSWADDSDSFETDFSDEY